MRISAVALSVIACMLTLSTHAQEADATHSARQPSSLSTEAMIPVTPCRLIDTRVELAGSATASSRTVAIKGTRCGSLVAHDASAYVVRVSRFDWRTTSDPQFGRAPHTELRTINAAAPGLYDFPVPASGHIAVDIEGYLLPPGARRPPSAPHAGNAPADEGRMSAAALGPRRPVAHNDIGDLGAVYVDGSVAPYPTTGVLLKASEAAPHVVARAGTNNSNSGGFLVMALNDTALSHMRTDGIMWLPQSGYLSGRSDYLGGSSANMPQNFVHRVEMINPKNQNGQADGQLTFFSAKTGHEAGSPKITKFEAYTDGYYAQPNINFDSQIAYHHGTQYHYRAFSVIPQIDTFWVKAMSSTTSASSGTRADMFVSGNVGIGDPSTLAKLTVFAPNATTHTANVATSYSGIRLTVATAGSLVLRTLAGGHAQVATDGANNYLSFATGVFAERMRINSVGNVGIGTIAPTALLDVNGSSRIGGNLTVVGALAGGQATFGNVGIGTTAPAALLDVNGASRIGGNLTLVGALAAGHATFGGDVTVNGILTGTKVNAHYQDIAEWVPASVDMEPGTVVILNPAISNEVMPSNRSYDTTVAGVVSAEPGIILGEGSPTKEQVATTGRVKVKVDATVGAIRIGDLLVTSDKPGTAMKSEPLDLNGVAIHRPGTLIGKALEPLASGTGEILVLLSMQ